MHAIKAVNMKREGDQMIDQDVTRLEEQLLLESSKSHVSTTAAAI